MLVLILITVVEVVLVAAGQPTVEVTLKKGVITGSREHALNGYEYYSFSTIPYARPPVGPLRFKDPEPAPAWSGVRNGSLPFPKCPQSSILLMTNYLFTGQEDCLYLNVYTPRPYKSNLPVMVFIHGGAYMVGSAMGSYPPMLPAPLVQKDVVVVAMNYRIGALGFLSTGDSVLPGNLGLKDQTLALQWIQDNIMDLGGDPNRVTIFGISAGGVSSHLHILSPSSAGLFQRAILQSGTALLAPTYVPARKGAISISKALNCTGEKSQQLLACFMNASVENLVNAQSSLTEWFDLPMTVGVQVDGTFLPEHPAVLLRSGRYNKVDVIIGWTKDDGTVITAGMFSEKGEKSLRDVNENFQKVGPILFSLMEEEHPVYLAQRIRFHYMEAANVTLDNEPVFTSLVGDAGFVMPGVQSAEFHAKIPHIKTFIYKLEHCSENSLASILAQTSIRRKIAGHGDDVQYLFQSPPPLGPLSRPQDVQVQDIITTLWTNFAYTGNPTVNGTLGFRWTPVTPEQPLRYLSITTTPTMQSVDKRIQDFWNSVPTKTTKLLYPERFFQCEEGYGTSQPFGPSCTTV
ncbi:cholinesterase 1-like [Scylla paramamosain]|uniref:cholinesterase 1-like n=1 Tax=Scylla paramamosain TaxID=85552 RepID=UPI00308331DB